MLHYQKLINERKPVSDPWLDLANAIVGQAADDYRSNMEKKLSRGLSMKDIELSVLNGRLSEIGVFFKGDWGYMLSRGLAPTIYEKLQAEYAERLADFNVRYPYMVKHRRKVERRRKRSERRWANNKARRKRKKVAQ